MVLFQIFTFVIHAQPPLPFAARENQFRCTEKNHDNAKEIKHVARIDDTTAQRAVVSAHAQLLDEQVDLAEQRERIDELEADKQKTTKENWQDKSQYLIVGQRTTKNTDAHETRAEQE